MDLSWDDLRYLLAVERTGSLAAAAAALAVDQTTVGRRITALQVACGARLVERGAAGSRLTAAGRRACAVARAMEATVRGLDREVGADGGLDGAVRLSAPESFVPVLPRALSDLAARHPGIRVELLTGTQELSLVRREADLAIRMMNPAQASLVTKKLATAPWGVFASDAYLARRGAPPDGPAHAWASHEVIGYVGPIARAPGAQWLATEAAEARVVLRTNNALSAVAAAGEGMAIVAAPAFIAAQDARLRSVVARSVGAGTVHLLVHKDLAAVPRVRATIDHLTGWFRTRWQA